MSKRTRPYIKREVIPPLRSLERRIALTMYVCSAGTSFSIALNNAESLAIYAWLVGETLVLLGGMSRSLHLDEAVLYARDTTLLKITQMMAKRQRGM